MMEELRAKFQRESFHLNGPRDKSESTTSFVSNVQEVENFFLIANRLAPWKHGGSNSGSFVKYSIAHPSAPEKNQINYSYREVPDTNTANMMKQGNYFGRNRASTTKQTPDLVM